jgi:hypothetical protein
MFAAGSVVVRKDEDNPVLEMDVELWRPLCALAIVRALAVGRGRETDLRQAVTILFALAEIDRRRGGGHEQLGQAIWDLRTLGLAPNQPAQSHCCWKNCLLAVRWT